MTEEQRVFLVIRCTSCERHFGSLRNDKTFTCPGCGKSGEHPIVGRAKDSGDLKQKVSLANVPPELRDEMKRKIKIDDYQDYQEDSASAPALLKLLSNLVDENGKLNVIAVQNELNRRVQLQSGVCPTQWLRELNRSEVFGSCVEACRFLGAAARGISNAKKE